MSQTIPPRRTFVIDENVFVFAHTIQNEHGVIDTASAQLVGAIVGHCHALALSAELHRRYVRKHRELELRNSPVLGKSVISYIMIASAVNPGKAMMVPTPDLQSLTVDNAVPYKDHFLVRLAVLARAILVTTDEPLILALREPGIMTLYGVQVLRPDDALPIARA